MTDDEIRGYMNFDRLLELQKRSAASRSFLGNKFILIAGFIIIVGTFSWLILGLQTTNEKDLDKQAPTEKAQASSKDFLINPDSALVSSSVRNGSEGDEVAEEKIEVTNEIPLSRQEDAKPQAADLRTTGKVKSPVSIVKPGLKDPVYIQAAPVEGYPALYDYFNLELRYPQQAMKDSLQGEIVAVFTINVDGQPENIVIENSLGPLFDQEVVRLISNMPPWKPATYNGKPRPSKMSLPLTFQIKKITLPK